MFKFNRFIFVIFIFSTCSGGVFGIEYGNELWPYAVSVQKNDKHLCVGTVIGDRAILTSYKCINVNVSNSDDFGQDLSIDLNLNKQRKGLKYQVVKAVHNVKDLHEDLAILFVKNPIEELQFNDLKISSYKAYNFGRIIYWKLSENSGYYEIAQKPAHMGCSSSVNLENHGEFCAKTVGKDRCIAELGSPLIQTYTENKYEPAILGILTVKGKCNGRGIEKNIFIDIGSYKEKLESIIESTIKEIEINIKKQSTNNLKVEEKIETNWKMAIEDIDEDENEDEHEEENEDETDEDLNNN